MDGAPGSEMQRKIPPLPGGIFLFGLIVRYRFRYNALRGSTAARVEVEIEGDP
jgi:hypothetical protein